MRHRLTFFLLGNTNKQRGCRYAQTMQGNAAAMAGRYYSDCTGNGDAAGMSAAEMCCIDRAFADRSGNLAPVQMWGINLWISIEYKKVKKPILFWIGLSSVWN